MHSLLYTDLLKTDYAQIGPVQFLVTYRVIPGRLRCQTRLFNFELGLTFDPGANSAHYILHGVTNITREVDSLLTNDANCFAKPLFEILVV